MIGQVLRPYHRHFKALGEILWILALVFVFDFTTNATDLWSFQPVQRPDVPNPDRPSTWQTNPIDAFVFDRLQQEGLVPSAFASPLSWLRRISFDVHGLPPTPEEVRDWGDRSLEDHDLRAAKVDVLLGRPHYGERMGRRWLDLVRFAESDGFRADFFRANAWRYRDYVIQSFNEDLPFKRFILEQLAGDEIAPNDPDALIATGFLRLGIYEYNQRDVRTQWNDIINEITDVTGDVFLGLGVGCARCHDHKFDPISQKDYFALQAMFTPIAPRESAPVATAEAWQVFLDQQEAYMKATQSVRKKMDTVLEPALKSAIHDITIMFPKDIQRMMTSDPGTLTPLEKQLARLANRQVEYERERAYNKLGKEAKIEWEELKKELADFDHLKPTLPRADIVSDIGPDAPPTIIPSRDPENARVVEPGFIESIPAPSMTIQAPPTAPNSTGRRTALARWLTQSEHPLTARVVVNRLWQYHFGTGLVATSSDFGNLGTPPSHPELLDWLASELVENNWSVKHINRLILTSATYAQSSSPSEFTRQRAEQIDPENRWLWKKSMRRLEAEEIRDASLVASGELDLKIGGPSVSGSNNRRGVYVKVIRNQKEPMLEAFNTAQGFSSMAQRDVTTTAEQALMMMNGNWAVDRAEILASNLLQSSHPTDADRVREAFLLCLSRPASPAEVDLALRTFEIQTATSQDTKLNQERWTEFCHALLNANEFLYLD